MGDGDGSGWVDLRAPGGRLLARYDPSRSLLEFRRGSDRWLFDLRELPDPASPKTAVPPEGCALPAGGIVTKSGCSDVPY